MIEQFAIDPSLAYFMGFVEREGVELPVTISVDGLVITGNLVPSARFTAAAGDFLVANGIVEGETQLRPMADRAVANAMTGSHEPDERYIHLFGVQMLAGAIATPNPGFWRVRAYRVSAFMLGFARAEA